MKAQRVDNRFCLYVSKQIHRPSYEGYGPFTALIKIRDWIRDWLWISRDWGNKNAKRKQKKRKRKGRQKKRKKKNIGVALARCRRPSGALRARRFQLIKILKYKRAPPFFAERILCMHSGGLSPFVCRRGRPSTALGPIFEATQQHT